MHCATPVSAADHCARGGGMPSSRSISRPPHVDSTHEIIPWILPPACHSCKNIVDRPFWSRVGSECIAHVQLSMQNSRATSDRHQKTSSNGSIPSTEYQDFQGNRQQGALRFRLQACLAKYTTPLRAIPGALIDPLASKHVARVSP
jgi:hypothetical protein